MLLIELNKARRLLHLTYFRHIRAAELREHREEIEQALEELPVPFHLLADMTYMESMEVACRDEIVRTMEICNRKGVEAVVRVIPEPARDIGLNILSAFHYGRHVRVITCASLEEGLLALAPPAEN